MLIVLPALNSNESFSAAVCSDNVFFTRLIIIQGLIGVPGSITVEEMFFCRE